jgi:hypothetical protein
VSGLNLTAGLQAPLVHMNGSGKSELMAQLATALAVVRDLEKALAEARPHKRDYYPLQNSPDPFDDARKQHYRREEAVVQVRHELVALLLAIEAREIITK